MTQEEKYRKALLEARAVLEPCLKYSNGKVREALDSIDKELKSFESEDERILRVISEAVITFFSDYANDFEDEDRDAALAWLEKQKEQKPNIELIQRSWYMEGYNDRKFGNEPKWIIKTGEGGPKHELNPRYGQPLTERQVTEEQLHNLNEAIKSYRMDGFDRIADSLHSLYNILTTQAQKSAEWSDEDKEMLECVIMDVESAKENYLKSTTEVVRQGAIIADKELAWLKSLRPSWKPSEEQMKALEAATVRYQSTGLESLYEDLKKL